MTLDFILASIIGLFIFLSLAVVWALLSAPILFGFLLFAAPLLLVFSIILFPLSIVWGWFYNDHEILGTEPDAVPG